MKNSDKVDNRRVLIVSLTELVDGIRVEWVEDKGQFIFPEVVYSQCKHKIFGKEWVVYVDSCCVSNYMGLNDCIRIVSKLWKLGTFSELGEVILDV